MSSFLLSALHGASSYPGAQFYVRDTLLIGHRSLLNEPSHFPQMECAQLRITGGGSANPATVNFPGAYSGKFHTISWNLS